MQQRVRNNGQRDRPMELAMRWFKRRHYCFLFRTFACQRNLRQRQRDNNPKRAGQQPLQYRHSNISQRQRTMVMELQWQQRRFHCQLQRNPWLFGYERGHWR